MESCVVDSLCSFVNPSENATPFVSSFFHGTTSPRMISQYDSANDTIQFQAVDSSPHICASYQTNIKSIKSCLGIPINNGNTPSVLFVTNDGLYFHNVITTTLYPLCLILFGHYRNEKRRPSSKRMNSRSLSSNGIIVFPEESRALELE